jgi:hypothetical protein
MIARGLQILSLALALLVEAAAAAPLQPGTVHDLSFRDIDGQDLGTAAGHITVITVTTRAQENEARAIAKLMPHRYLGDPKYRYATLVNFEGKLPAPLRGLTRIIIRNRMDAEARQLKPKYEAKQLTRDPRKDIYVIPDFDGNGVTRLGLSLDSNEAAVFLFDSRGKLLARWHGVPPEEAFVKALESAE